jgi:protein TonB
MGSVVAHAAFAAALILFPGLRSRKTLVPDALVVSLVEAPRPAGGPIAAPAPPPPADAPALETARLEPREPPPPKPLPENPRPKTKKEPKPTPEKAAPTRTAPAGASGPAEAEPGSASGAAGPPQPGAASVAMAGGVDSAFAWYRDSVVGAILTQWRRPVLDGLSEPLDVLIAVEILPDGDVRNLRVDQSSGVPALDRSALRAVADAVPLPPLPMHWPEATWNVAIIFRQHPE